VLGVCAHSTRRARHHAQAQAVRAAARTSRTPPPPPPPGPPPRELPRDGSLRMSAALTCCMWDHLKLITQWVPAQRFVLQVLEGAPHTLHHPLPSWHLLNARLLCVLYRLCLCCADAVYSANWLGSATLGAQSLQSTMVPALPAVLLKCYTRFWPSNKLCECCISAFTYVIASWASRRSSHQCVEV
jgi:hypothetical protein